MAERILPQMRVQQKETGRTGTTCPDCMGCCTDQETPVVWDGTDSFSGTYTDELVVLGPENAVADEKCGIGRGSDCCIFAVLDASGLKCGRFGPLRFDLILDANKMTARREPTAPYPDCKLLE